MPSVVLKKYSGSQSARSRLGLSAIGKELLEEIAVVDALVFRVLAEVGGHVLFEAGGGGVFLLLLGRVHLVGGLLEIPTAGDVGAEEVGLLVVEQVLLDRLLDLLGHAPQEGVEVVGLHLARLDHPAHEFVVDAVLRGPRMGCQEVPDDLGAKLGESASIDQAGDDELAGLGLAEVQHQVPFRRSCRRSAGCTISATVSMKSVESVLSTTKPTSAMMSWTSAQVPSEVSW